MWGIYVLAVSNRACSFEPTIFFGFQASGGPGSEPDPSLDKSTHKEKSLSESLALIKLALLIELANNKMALKVIQSGSGHCAYRLGPNPGPPNPLTEIHTSYGKRLY